jgi:hypothetical protein
VGEKGKREDARQRRWRHPVTPGRARAAARGARRAERGSARESACAFALRAQQGFNTARQRAAVTPRRAAVGRAAHAAGGALRRVLHACSAAASAGAGGRVPLG